MPDSTPTAAPGIRLLSLDGGGIRGLSSLIILKEILYDYKIQNGLKDFPRPHEFFDLAGGTSTGGLIVIMLFRLKMSIDEAIDAYLRLSTQVFSKRNWFLRKASFNSRRLEAALLRLIKDNLGIQDDAEAWRVRLLDEDSPKCFVCAVPVHHMSSLILFRSWKPALLAFHRRTTIIEAARATLAAPSFFKSVEILGDEGLTETFVNDGVLVANPVKYVLEQARELFPNSNIDYVLSLGTGLPSLGNADTNHRIFKSPTQTKLMRSLSVISTDSEATTEEVGRRFFDTPGVYYRLNVDRGPEGVSLSEWENLDAISTHTRRYLLDDRVSKKVGDLVAKLHPGPTSPSSERNKNE